jgi:hypothetical protein
MSPLAKEACGLPLEDPSATPELDRLAKAAPSDAPPAGSDEGFAGLLAIRQRLAERIHQIASRIAPGDEDMDDDAKDALRTPTKN